MMRPRVHRGRRAAGARAAASAARRGRRRARRRRSRRRRRGARRDCRHAAGCRVSRHRDAARCPAPTLAAIAARAAAVRRLRDRLRSLRARRVCRRRDRLSGQADHARAACRHADARPRAALAALRPRARSRGGLGRAGDAAAARAAGDRRLRSAALTLPARGVGGDFFLSQQIGPTRFALALGDVSGKGMPAGLVASSLQARIEAVARHARGTAQRRRRRRQSRAVRHSDAARFATLAYLELDTERSRITVVNAGHLPRSGRRRRAPSRAHCLDGPALGHPARRDASTPCTVDLDRRRHGRASTATA